MTRPEHQLVSVSAGSELGGNGDSGAPDITADGRFVAYDSFAPDLVTGDTNDEGDVFVRQFTPAVSAAPTRSTSVESLWARRARPSR